MCTIVSKISSFQLRIISPAGKYKNMTHTQIQMLNLVVKDLKEVIINMIKESKKVIMIISQHIGNFNKEENFKENQMGFLELKRTKTKMKNSED